MNDKTPSPSLAGQLDALAGRLVSALHLSDKTRDTEIRTIAAELRAVGAAGGWRPIESAPLDGTKILVLHEGMTQPSISWVTELDVGYYKGSVWQPLPAPPALTPASQEPSNV